MGVTAHYNHEVPLESHQQDIMVEITGPSTKKRQTADLDLVVVLDTSGSMGKQQKLADMKQAAKFVIQKIGAMDTLVFVPFSDKAGEPSNDPPLQMSPERKSAARRFVDARRARGNTNIESGLRAAIDILRRRTDQTGRAAGIFLMSDGLEHLGDARSVRRVANFPVFTFGFGSNHDKQVRLPASVVLFALSVSTHPLMTNPGPQLNVRSCFTTSRREAMEAHTITLHIHLTKTLCSSISLRSLPSSATSPL